MLNARRRLRPYIYPGRIPVILRPEDYELWLEEGEREQPLLRELLRPYPEEKMTGYAVSPAVNSTRGGGPELIVESPLNSA